MKPRKPGVAASPITYEKLPLSFFEDSADKYSKNMETAL